MRANAAPVLMTCPMRAAGATGPGRVPCARQSETSAGEGGELLRHNGGLGRLTAGAPSVLTSWKQAPAPNDAAMLREQIAQVSNGRPDSPKQQVAFQTHLPWTSSTPFRAFLMIAVNPAFTPVMTAKFLPSTNGPPTIPGGCNGGMERVRGSNGMQSTL